MIKNRKRERETDTSVSDTTGPTPRRQGSIAQVSTKARPAANLSKPTIPSILRPLRYLFRSVGAPGAKPKLVPSPPTRTPNPEPGKQTKTRNKGSVITSIPHSEAPPITLWRDRRRERDKKVAKIICRGQSKSGKPAKQNRKDTDSLGTSSRGSSRFRSISAKKKKKSRNLGEWHAPTRVYARYVVGETCRRVATGSGTTAVLRQCLLAYRLRFFDLSSIATSGVAVMGAAGRRLGWAGAIISSFLMGTPMCLP